MCYKNRSNNQLNNWVNGLSLHNDVDDECCPDFSCCSITQQVSYETRFIYREKFRKKRRLNTIKRLFKN